LSEVGIACLNIQGYACGKTITVPHQEKGKYDDKCSKIKIGCSVRPSAVAADAFRICPSPGILTVFQGDIVCFDNFRAK
jgi:hypothetical protein